MINGIAYGTENGRNYYVQTLCNHDDCVNCKDIMSFGEEFSRRNAIKLARKKAREFKVGLVTW